MLCCKWIQGQLCQLAQKAAQDHAVHAEKRNSGIKIKQHHIHFK
jgi:hypothetical protein